MKARDRGRVGALRLIVAELQNAAREGSAEEVEVLLERSHHLVPRARQLGGDLVG